MIYFAIIITVAVIAGFVIYKTNEKKNTIKAINKLRSDFESSRGSFIEKWDEERLILESKIIQAKIEKKKYSFAEAVQFKSFKDELPKLIYTNNLEILEKDMSHAMESFNEQLGNGTTFVLSPCIKELADAFGSENKEYADKSVRYDSRIIQEFMSVYNDVEKYIKDINSAYMNKEKAECKQMFDDIDGRSLDDNQRDAVVNDDLRQLVIAGAGSGKTLTMSAKVKYLVERKNINPKDILLISFTRKAAEEMGSRIRKLGIDIDSATFHKYGLSVIRNVQLKTPDVAEDLGQYLDSYLRDVIYNDDKLAKGFLVLMGTLMLPVSDANDTLGDRISAEQRQDLTTIKGMYEAYANKQKIKRIEDEITDLQVELDPLRQKLGPLHEKIEKLLKDTQDDENNNDINDESLNKTKEEVKEVEKSIAVLEAKVSELKNAKTSIRNERMKSAEEVMLANMFFLDGVPYIYEDEYPYDEEDNLRKRYRPDFHLTEADLYWEHFGVNEYGKAPQYGEVPEKQYLEGMEWKRDLHRKNNTNLAETYSWQFRKNVIAKAIEENYEKFGVEKHEVRYCDVIREILKGDSVDNIESFKSLLGTFISLFKAYGYDISMFNQFELDISKYQDNKLSPEALERRKTRDRLFLDFAEEFYRYYSQKLAEEHKIDFNDMILQATSYIEHGEYVPPYKYVIIDEYQDISVGRYLLTRATLEKSGAKLFCVGDDWQSIYRFSGSEVDLFVNFKTYFGEYSQTFIDKTYRNSQELLNISGAFVMQNDYQTPKMLRSDKHLNDPIRECMYTGRYNPILEDENAEIDISMAKAFMCAVDDIVKDCPDGSILVLGRNNGDIRELSESREIMVDKKADEIKILVDKYPNVDISYLTVHRSKGLEADNVILLNMKNSRAGFPNQIVDDPILNLLRRTKETFPFAEERRLFYVAITRTRNKTYLLVPISKSSRFVDDLRALYNKDVRGKIDYIYPSDVAGILDRDIKADHIKPLMCPVCKVGTLVKKKGAEGKIFVSCSNFPSCSYSTGNLDSVRKNNRCPKCDNFLTKRNGKYGEFMGCMSYPYCTYSANIVAEANDQEEQNDKRGERAFAYVKKPVSSNQKWTVEEDIRLKSEFASKMSIGEMAAKHQRTNGAIVARLKKLGLYDE